jgi:predicted methyltransferase
MKYLVKLDCSFDYPDGITSREIYEEFNSFKDLIIGICSIRKHYSSLLKIYDVKYYVQIETNCNQLLFQIIEKYKNSDILYYSEDYFQRIIEKYENLISDKKSQLKEDLRLLSCEGIDFRIEEIENLKLNFHNTLKQKENWLKRKQQFEEDIKCLDT